MPAAAALHRARIAIIAAFALVLTVSALRGAVAFYGRPFASVLVDPEGVVSSIGLPHWQGYAEGLRYPDRIVAVDGVALSASSERYPAMVWDRAVDEAARAGRSSVDARVVHGTAERTVRLRIVPFEPLAWWVYGGGLILIATLYVGAALAALAASPKGPLARTFAQTALVAAVFLATLFDYHTTRALVPLLRAAYGVAWIGFVLLPLRLPDDVALLRRSPRLVRVADIAVIAIAGAMVALDLAGSPASALRSHAARILGALLATSFLFFATTFLVRFARAR